MTLADVKRKYKGRPLDMAKWRFSGMVSMGNLALAANDVELDDGCFYDFRATIRLDWSGKPSDIMRHGDYGTFSDMFAVSVTRNGEQEPMENGGDVFVDAIDTMIVPSFGLEPSTTAKAIVLRNDVYPYDYPNHKGATREECDRAWEAIKRELVHYTARKFGFPEPQDLSDKPEEYPFNPPLRTNCNRRYPKENLLAYRMEFEYYFCGAGRSSPSWSRSLAWVNLRNAMLDEMFDRVGVDLPPEAHSLPYMYNGKKHETWNRLLPKRHWNIENGDGGKQHAEWPKFPFDAKELEEAKSDFLNNDKWRAIYHAASEGAKRRLELSFWFSHSGKKKIDDEAKANDVTTLMMYRDYRTEIEKHMSIEDLTFMVEKMNDEEAIKHYRQLIETKNNPNARYMTYDQFFKLVRDQGEYKVHKCSNEKQSIVKDFLSFVVEIHDPLETQLEDIFATAKVREVRTYPANGWMYVRIWTRLLNGNAKWGKPFQIVALLDSCRQLKGYTFTEAGLIFEFHPNEINGKETDAQRHKRQELREHREHTTTKKVR